jgi:flagellar basal body-associated protein FliL
MSPIQAPEMTGSGAAAPPGASRPELMSPLGYLVMAGVMAATAGLVYVVTASFHDAGPRPVLDARYEELDLGPFVRELAADGSSLVRDQFMARIVLVLNTGHPRLAEIKGLVEKRRNLMKDIVWREILYPKSDEELRRATVLDALAEEIKRSLNATLGASKEGPEVVARVIIPESRLPARR